MTTQKEIASDLDRAAGRACLVDREGATRKQCWFLAKLILEAGGDASDVECECTRTQAVLTKSRASHLIDQYLNTAKAA